jgi:hypothetical protein
MPLRFFLDQLDSFGQPWHGQIDGGARTLTLPNGTTMAMAQTANELTGDTHYQCFGLPDPATPNALVQQGGRLYGDVVWFGTSKYYSPKVAGFSLGANSWVYRAPSGKRWLINSTLAWNGGPDRFVDTFNYRLRVNCNGEFGYFGQTPSAPVQIHESFPFISQFIPSLVVLAAPDNADTHEGLNRYYDLGVLQNGHTKPNTIIVPSPDGSRCFVQPMLTPVPIGGGYIPTEWAAGFVWLLELNEPSAGATPTVTVSIYRNEQSCRRLRGFRDSETYCDTHHESVDVFSVMNHEADARVLLTMTWQRNGVPLPLEHRRYQRSIWRKSDAGIRTHVRSLDVDGLYLGDNMLVGLTKHTEADQQPTFSPDFIGGYQIFTVAWPIEFLSNNVLLTGYLVYPTPPPSVTVPYYVLVTPDGKVTPVGFTKPTSASWNPRTGQVAWSASTPVGWV